MSKCYKTWMTVDLGYDKAELAIAKEEMRKVVDQLGYIEPEFIPIGRLLRWDTNDFLDGRLIGGHLPGVLRINLSIGSI